MTERKQILVVAGPTATGKTNFAVQMAKLLSGEVVSADCMLVYRGMDIGTAKPTLAERDGIAHHLIDILAPTQSFSAGDYAERAIPLCEELLAAGKTPIVCGGTGFYIQSLLFCRSNGNIGADAVCRARYEEIVRIEGKEGLYARLCAVDPESAAILHPNDVKRVSRALEIYDLTGKKKSAQRDGFMPRFSYVAVAFDYAREELYARIDARVDEMLRLGLVDEVRALRDAGVPDYAQSMQGIGYKEVLNYLNGEVSFSTMSDIIKKNTRNYAKRQITFFKKFPGIVWLDPLNKYNAEIVQEQMNHG